MTDTANPTTPKPPLSPPVDARRRRFPPRRRAALILVGLALLGGSVWSLARESLGPDSWTRVERRDLVLGVDVEGELEAIESASIGPPQVPDVWDLKISMMIPEGTEVQEGQPVLGFDTTLLQQQLQEKIAERDEAQKQLEKKTTDFEINRRDKELRLAEAQAALRKANLKLAVPEEISARKDLEQARIDRRLAEREIDFLSGDLEHLVEQRRAELESLRERRDRAAGRVDEIRSHVEQMTVKAPRAGTVIYKTGRWQDEKRKVGDRVWRAETVLEIPDLQAMRARGEVAEADAGRLAVGQRVTFRMDAYPDSEYPGTVRKIHRSVQRKSRSSGQKVVRLEIAIDKADSRRMRPGMRFRGTIETERIADTLVVPSAAVHVDSGGTTVVRRKLFGREQVSPSFGKRNSEHFEITGGLEEGDWVLRRGGGPEGAP